MALIGPRQVGKTTLAHAVAAGRPSLYFESSWEGFVIENLLAACPPGTQAGFYRTAAGAEIDLLLELGAAHGVWAVEIKRSASPGLQKGNHHALADIAPRRSFYVHGGPDRFPMTAHTEAISLPALAAELAALR